MGGPSNELSAWAASLTMASIPEDVARVARLQHLALVGAARRLASLPSGVHCGADERGTIAAFLLFAFDDHLLGGRVGAAAAPVGWSHAAGTLDQLIAATVAANELAGRAGLACLLAHRPDEVDVRTMRVAAAVMRCKLAGGSAAAMNAALEGALAGGGALPMAAVADVAGAQQAAAGILDSRGSGSLDDAMAGTPLLNPWTGAGSAWLTRTLVVPRFPGTPWANVALDALDVILVRHMKAGEKRLRADQVERIELRTAFGPAATEAGSAGFGAPALGAWSIAEVFGVMVAHHELGPEWLDVGAAPDKLEEVAAVASRLSIVHDWRLSVRKGRIAAEALGPLIGAAGTGSVLRAAKPLLLGRPEPESLLPMFQERPWSIVKALRRRGGLERCDLAAAMAWPTELKLYTTRGGWWPERRSVPTGGGPGLEAAAKARFGHDTRADALLAARGDQPASEWIAELRA